MPRLFNGTSDFIAANAAAFDPYMNPWTIAFWAKSSSATTNLYMVGLGFSGDVDNILGALWEGGSLRIFWRTAAGTVVVDDTHSTTGLNDGAWHHYAIWATGEGSSYGLAVDGNAETATFTTLGSITFDRLTLGALVRTGAAASFFPGTLAHVAIWDRVLNTATRTALARGANPALTAPAHYWPLWGVDSPEPDIGTGSRTLTVTDRVHVHTDAADPAAITTGTLASRAYLLLHVLAGEGPTTDAYTWDADYTAIAGTGTTGSTDPTNIHVRAGYRIATLTTDTVDVTSTTADRDYTQGLVAMPIASAGSVGDRGSTSSKTAGVSLSMSPSADVLPGDILVVFGAWDNPNNATHTGPLDTLMYCGDSVGNQYVRLIDAQNANGTDNGTWAMMFICYVQNRITTADTVKLHQQGSRTARSMALWEFSGAPDFTATLPHVAGTLTGTSQAVGGPPLARRLLAVA